MIRVRIDDEDNFRVWMREEIAEAQAAHEAMMANEAMCLTCGSEYPEHTDTAHEPCWSW